MEEETWSTIRNVQVYPSTFHPQSTIGPQTRQSPSEM